MVTGFSPLNNEFLVNTVTTHFQDSPSITSLADGGFVVTWTSVNQDGSLTGVYGQRYDALGATVGTEFLINTETNDKQESPSITSLADGGFVVTWTSDNQDGSLTGVYGQRYDVLGAKDGAEFLVNTETNSLQQDPSITSLANGGFVVVWQSAHQDGSDYGVYGQRYDALGAKDGVEFLVNTEVSLSQWQTSIASFADGGFVVGWISMNQDGGGWGVYGQRFDDLGARDGAEFPINTETNYHQYYPSITSLTDGGFVVTWTSENQDGSASGVYGQRYDALGARDGAEFLINTETASYQESPSITSLADGGFVVTWQSGNQDGGGWGVYGQRYDASGAVVGEEFLINTETIHGQYTPSITSLANGGFVVTWRGEDQDGHYSDIYAQQFAAQLFGTADADTITDSVGANWINGQGGDDVLDGGDGDDRFEELYYDTDGSDTYIGGTGVDTLVSGEAATNLAGWTFDLTNGIQSFDGNNYDTFSGIENLTVFGAATLIGDASDNLLTGHLGASSGGFSMSGMAGNDTLNGSAGNDTFDGGDGDDTVFAGEGDDVVTHSSDLSGVDAYHGGAGNDTLLFTHDWGGTTVHINLTDGAMFTASGTSLGSVDGFENVEIIGGGKITGDGSVNQLVGGGYLDVLKGEGGNDTLIGGAGDDRLHGGSAHDRLVGGRNDDTLFGNAGEDLLRGGRGKDTLSGGNGADRLIGGRGQDALTGGDGSDIFIFATGDSVNSQRADVITDFEVAVDYIDLSKIGGLTFIGRDTFSGRTGEVSARDNGVDTIIRIDADGDGTADMKIVLEGVSKLISGDFIL